MFFSETWRNTKNFYYFCPHNIENKL